MLQFMKNRFLQIDALVLLLLMVVAAKANPVSQLQARKIGAKYLQANTDVRVASAEDLQLATTYRTESSAAAFYIFNGPSSFVIVAADDCATPILGMSSTHQFDLNNIPPALEWYLQGFVEQIQYGIESHLPAIDTVAHQWELVQTRGLLIENRATTLHVEPLLTSKWGQGSNGYMYNLYCPADPEGPNGHAITGCTATAMGQVMRYWKYPKRGTGSHSYTLPGYGTLYANFGNTTYDWDNMPDELYPTSTDAQNNAVATLLYHCGVAVEMEYSADNSGAFFSVDALVNYFNYSSELTKVLKADYTNSQWFTLFQNCLDKGRPILYSGWNSVTGSGHSFVCDGYNANNQLHFNWGWRGNNDDYYAVGALTPGTHEYNSSNEAYINMYPGECEDNSFRTLPYSDSFEIGETDFFCYGKLDYQNAIHAFRSSWTTYVSNGGVAPYSGNMCIRRKYNSTSEGNSNDWLIMRPFFLQPGRDYSTLTFKSYEQFPDDYTFEGVYVATLEDESFTQIWTQNNPSASWKTVSIDLNAYSGQIITLAFVYTGTNGHSWYIDDINIEQTWAVCTVASLPFEDHFSSNIGGCWYIIDGDMSGEQRCWQWKESTQSAYHPYGQQNKPQVGWLISRALFLQPGRDATELNFYSASTSSGTGQKNSVWIAIDKPLGALSPSDFTVKVWEDPDYSNSWTSYSVDLSEYQGHIINIGFKYEGTYAHNWFVDDVVVTERWQPCSSATAPYFISFDSGLGGCWYVIDSDQSGGERCWKYDQSSHSVYHTWGQEGKPQVGWLFSNRIWLPTNKSYRLSFKSKCVSSGEGRKSSVRIAVDKGDTPNPSDYTEIWVDPSYSSSWTTYEIDLSAYSGHYVSIAFKYEGTYAHSWYIDDFNISELPTYTITASASPTAGGSVSGGGTYIQNSTCTLTATANSGYTFVNWTKNGTQVSTNASYTFTVTGNAEYVAHFEEIPSGPQLTVYPNATETNNAIPMYVYYFDDFTRAQHVIPASELTAMSGGQIMAIKYYTSESYIPYTTASEIDFYLKEVSSPTLSAFVDKSTAQIVYHGTVSFVAADSGGEVVINFATPFIYNGGNLLVGCDNTTDAGYKNIAFIGEEGHTNSALYGSNTASLADVQAQPSSFLPKSTFIYTGGGGGGTVTQTTNFTSGWNWWSGYVELDGANSLQSLENGLGTHGMTIKSQNNGYASYLSGFGWYGSLSSINNECTYQVKTDAACTVSLTGNAANPASHPVTLTSGWTWVGYPVNASMSVATAMSGITPQTGDMLKSQNNGYASYLSGYGWYGSLSTLNPGMGLMYKSNRSSSITLTYPNGGSKGELKANQTAENNHWRPNLTAYPDNMSVMAVVELDGNELQGESYELAAFANGECRGSARLMYVEPLDRYVAFLTVAGDESADLRFSLFNAETGAECHNAEEALTYETNAVVGSLTEPFTIHFRSTMGVDDFGNVLRIYPNPAKSVIRIEGLEPGSEVRIYNSLGALVKVINANADREVGIGDLANGIYLVRCHNTSLRFVKE